MKFVMYRDRVIASVHGHAVRFEKGVPTTVPSAMWPEVLAAGGVPESELPEPEGPVSKAPKDVGERKALILAAIEDIAKRNQREEFTAGNAPHLSALKNILGFQVESRERDTLWAEFQNPNLKD